jgi:hypothetical protein
LCYQNDEDEGHEEHSVERLHFEDTDTDKRVKSTLDPKAFSKNTSKKSKPSLLTCDSTNKIPPKKTLTKVFSVKARLPKKYQPEEWTEEERIAKFREDAEIELSKNSDLSERMLAEIKREGRYSY